MFFLQEQHRSTPHHKDHTDQASPIMWLKIKSTQIPQESHIQDGYEPRIGRSENILDFVVNFVGNATIPGYLWKEHNEEEDNVNVILHVVQVEYYVCADPHYIILVVF